jgi:soluble lytic murein transglycosylase
MLAVAAACLAGPAAAQELSPADRTVYASAFALGETGAWGAARAAVAAANDPLLGKVLTWRWLQDDGGGAGFDQIAAFIQANPDWPGLTRLRLQAERTMPTTLAADRVAAWFDTYAPQTFDATMQYVAALDALGRRADAAAFARERWPDIDVTAAQQDRFLARFGTELTADDHWARLDGLIWDGRLDDARRMLSLVSADRRALANARILLAARENGVDAAIQAVPAALQDDEGLLWERLRWRRYYDRNDGAIEILARQPATVARPDAWWRERHIIARRLFNAGDPARAYAVAAGHVQAEGFPLAQAEWLSGFLALRFLDRPADALAHFQRLYDNVGTPISLARGAYWSGRASAVLGDADAARRWYQSAAAHDTVFYGQLAAGELGVPTVTALPPDMRADDADRATYQGRELVRIARQLSALGLADQADPFLIRLLLDTDTAQGYALLTDLAYAIDRPDIAVAASRRSIYDEVVFGADAYPVVDMPGADGRPEPALLHALIRQESGFDRDAVSRAGARGLMQLMPATAQTVAGDLGVAHTTDRLTADPTHNIRLGSTYLAQRLERFGGSYVAAIAAYNAGSGRIDRWIAERDPRAGRLDLYRVIDWVESIPIYETRNYVQRVLENVQVYRLRLGRTPGVGDLERDLMR